VWGGGVEIIRECVKLQHLPAGIERENFKIECRLFGGGPAKTMHVDYTSLQCVYERVYARSAEC